MKVFVIDGNRAVLGRPSAEAKTEDFEFGENEVCTCMILPSLSSSRLCFFGHF